MALIDDVKDVLRITSSDLDTEINDLISTVQADLALSGVYVTDTTNALIKRAINVYCKASFGYDQPESDRFMKSYNAIKSQLMLTRDYSDYLITFDINDSVGDPIKEAKITLTLMDNTDYTIYTNQSGLAYFYTRELQNVDYVVSKTGYTTSDKTTVDLTSTQTITVTLVVTS